MAFTTIDSAGSLFEAGNSGDKVEVQSGASTRTTIDGGTGADTLVFLSGTNAAGQTAIDVNLAGGADEIILSGSNVFSSTILAGAGGDTISMSGIIAFNNTDLKAGDGNDDLFIAAEGMSGGTDIFLGGGADTLVLSGGEANGGVMTGGSILGGAGADEITLQGQVDLSATTIFGGGGADLIVVSGIVGGESQINSDSSANGGGADTIDIGNGVVSATVKGKGGADEITISGTMGNSARVEGNAGADLITLSGGFAGIAGFAGGGSGNDTIAIFTGITNSSNTIKGGGGADSISFVDGGVVAEQASGTIIYGGAGADTIELGLIETGSNAIDRGSRGHSGYIGLSELSDSSLDAYDVVSGNADISGYFFAIDTAAGITSFTIGVYNDSDTTTPAITAGVVSGATWASADSTVTARAADLDEMLATKGTLVGFTAGTENFLFIQGGESGTSDDAVIKVNQAITGGFDVDTDYEFYVNLG